MEIKIIKKNSELSKVSFDDLKKKLMMEDKEDNQYRAKYGNQWRRPPSSVVQKPYRSQIDGTCWLMQCTRPRPTKPTK